MKNFSFIKVFLAICALYLPSRALELGVIAGVPTGLSAKYWVSDWTAFDAAAAWSFSDAEYIHVHADYLLHANNWIKVRTGELPLYSGIGALVLLGEEDSRVGVRVPFGASYLLGETPLDIFIEMAPVIELIPATEFNVNGGVGIRLRFGQSR
ncbi:MAG: hypothetical protein ACOC41_03740 [Chitinivibrionales bacterium]